MDKETNKKKKMLLAVIQGDDYTATVDELNRNGFFATVLSSTGGFLKKRSMTLMIGIDEERTQDVLDILKRCAGKRQQMTYSSMAQRRRAHDAGADERGRHRGLYPGPGRYPEILSMTPKKGDRRVAVPLFIGFSALGAGRRAL